MMWTLRIPVRDPDERVNVKAISELPDWIDDPEDRAVCQEVLWSFNEAAWPQECTVGQVVEVIESYEPHERKVLLKMARDRAGLPDIEEVEAQNRAEIASRAAAIRQAKTQGRPLRLAYTESGAIVDLDEVEADAAAERARAASLAARREAEAAERAVEARRVEEFRAAQEARLRRELPDGVPG